MPGYSTLEYFLNQKSPTNQDISDKMNDVANARNQGSEFKDRSLDLGPISTGFASNAVSQGLSQLQVPAISLPPTPVAPPPAPAPPPPPPAPVQWYHDKNGQWTSDPSQAYTAPPPPPPPAPVAPPAPKAPTPAPWTPGPISTPKGPTSGPSPGTQTIYVDQFGVPVNPAYALPGTYHQLQVTTSSGGITQAAPGYIWA